VRAVVVIPTYNEAGSVERVLERVLAADPRVDVLVVDDGSPDGTAALVRAMATADDRIHLLERGAKQGLGAAYRAGFAWGLARDYDAMVEMDADLSHPPERLPALLDGLDRADLVIGSRYVPGGRTVNWSPLRRAISRGGNAYVRLALGLPVHDATAGYRAYRRAVLEALPVASVQSNGYCFQVEMAHRTWQEGFRVLELPITFTERSAGVSKMSRQIVAEALVRVTLWALSGGRQRTRPTHPASVGAAGGLLLAGLLGGWRRLDARRRRRGAAAPAPGQQRDRHGGHGEGDQGGLDPLTKAGVGREAAARRHRGADGGLLVQAGLLAGDAVRADDRAGARDGGLDDGAALLHGTELAGGQVLA
jgi:dolichol-phosphate mannosyltransferase